MKKLICVSIFLVFSVAIYNISYPTYSYRYRLALTIEVDGKPHSGSSVIEVRWISQPQILPEMGRYQVEVVGQGALIDLEQHGAVVATLFPPSPNAPGDHLRSTQWLAGRVFLGVSESPEHFERMSGRQYLPPELLPGLIYFSNISDPKTARRINAADFPVFISPTARLVNASVEITTDPLSFDLERKLPWYATLVAQRKRGPTIADPSIFTLTDLMFVQRGRSILGFFKRLIGLDHL